MQKTILPCYYKLVVRSSSSTTFYRQWANFLPQTCIIGLIYHLSV